MIKSPKIALAHEFLTTLGGAEKVLIKLHHMYPDAPIYTLLSCQNFVKQYLPNAKIISSHLDRWPDFITSKHQLFLLQFPVAVEQFDFSKFDIVLSSSNSFMKGLITKPSTVHISYNHSPTRYIWDQTHDWIDQKKLGVLRPIIEWRFNILRQWDFLAADRVDLFIANSKHVAKRVYKYYRRESKIVYPNIPVKQFLPIKSTKKKDYFLIVSRLAPFKKFDLAVKAFNKLGLPLHIAGTGEELSYLKSIASKNITFHGFVSEEQKVKLLQEARAFIFPGEEDFGIVPVEAMASGTPVIAYGVGGILESVIPDQTGVFFDQPTVDSLIQSVKYFDQHSTKYTSQNCINRALKFDESVFAAKMEKIINYCFHHPEKIKDKNTKN